MKVDDIKAFKAPVTIIKLMSRTGWGTLTNEPLPGIKARLRRVERQFFINWTSPRIREPENKDKQHYYDLHFDFNGYTLNLEQVITGSDILYGVRGVKTTERVDYFHTLGFDKNVPNYYRLIIPLREKLNFLFQIERKVFADDFGWRHAYGTQATINRDVLDVCMFHDEKKKYYLAIESNDKQTYDMFNDKAHSVINGLGFLTGHLAGDAGWYFAYTDEDKVVPTNFYHNPMRRTMICGYTPINTNPFAWIRDHAEASRIYEAKFLKPASFAVFSNLCQKLFDSVDFSSAVLLILEASVASLIFRPGGYAIVLETMADLITGEEKVKGPMLPALSRKVRAKLNEVIDAECASLSEEDRETLLSKIKNINQITNKARLRAPFETFKIPLIKKDLELINTRNDFLHGRIPDLTQAGEGRCLDRKNKDLYYASMRFYTLLNRLILAWVGYENYILNHAKIQDRFTQISLEDESYYLKAAPLIIKE